MYKLLPFSEKHSYRRGSIFFRIYDDGNLIASEVYAKPLDVRTKSDFDEAGETPPIDVGDLQDYLILKIVE